MASLKDDVEIIKTAVYGKEMRPAIVDAFNQSWGVLQLMTGAVDQLNARIDELLDGGDVDPNKPTTSGCCVVDGEAVLCVDGATTPISAVGDADKL